MIEFKAPKENTSKLYSIFLAGAIDMGVADDWQKEVKDELKDFDVVLLNPRRDDWDKSWEQTKENKEFSEQVNWELDNLEKCRLIFVCYTKTCKAPITMLELGLHAKSKKIIVCCPKEFYRYGNVDIVCERNGIPLYNDFAEAMKALKKKLFAYGTK